MTASRLDELTVGIRAQASEPRRRNDCSCDFCTGVKNWDDNWCPKCAERILEAPKWWENLEVCSVCEAKESEENRLGDFALDHQDMASVTPPRLARGTTPEPCETQSGSLFPGNSEDDHSACTVALHESLTSLLELVAMIEQQGGHTWPWQQAAVWRAKQLLERHGRR